MEKQQRALTLKLGCGGLWLMCTTLPLIKVYLPIKFPYFKYKKQRAINLKLFSGGLWFLCSALLLNEIYTPLKFHVQICNSL